MEFRIPSVDVSQNVEAVEKMSLPQLDTIAIEAAREMETFEHETYQRTYMASRALISLSDMNREFCHPLSKIYTLERYFIQFGE